MSLDTKKSGVDAFIVHNSLSKKKPRFIGITNKKQDDFNNDFEQFDEQGLLPTTFICEMRHDNTCDLNERRCLPIQNQCWYSCLNYEQCKLEQDHNNFSCDLLKTLIKLVDKRLTKKQKLVLKKIVTTKKNTTMTSLSDRLSEELNISKTTARIILQTLRDVGIISCGRATNKGEPVRLTEIGSVIIDGLEKAANENKELKK